MWRFTLRLFWGGEDPPSSTSWRPAASVAPLGKILRKQIWGKFSWGGWPSSLPPLKHPLAACGRGGPFGSPPGHERQCCILISQELMISRAYNISRAHTFFPKGTPFGYALRAHPSCTPFGHARRTLLRNKHPDTPSWAFLIFISFNTYIFLGLDFKSIRLMLFNFCSCSYLIN